MTQRLEAYWRLQNGQKRMFSEMPTETYTIVFQQLREGTAIGQYTLPLDGAPDMQLSLPEKVGERNLAEQAQLAQVRADLATYIDIPVVERVT